MILTFSGICKKRIAFYLLIVLFFSSCGTVTKNVPYFQDLTLTSDTIRNLNRFKEPTIQPDDLLSISIFTTDPNTSLIINQLGASSSQVPSNSQSSLNPSNGALVDKEGFIDIPVVGKIRVVSLTTAQAKEIIHQKASVVYNKPTVQVKFANFKVTILGEVARPASYVVPNERVSVLDALGLAGDLTIFGRRENVLIIRDSASGAREYARLNLNSSDLFASKYFYLKQNDVVYVEPNKGKAASLNQARTQTIAIIGSALSVLVVLFSRI